MKIKKKIDYLSTGPDIEVDRMTSAETTQRICNEFSNVVLQRHFSLQAKYGTKAYQVLLLCVAIALQEVFKTTKKTTKTPNIGTSGSI